MLMFFASLGHLPIHHPVRARYRRHGRGRDENRLLRWDNCMTSCSLVETPKLSAILQESVFFLAECLTVVYFGRTSDRYGRRPVLLFGPLGLAIVMVGFGLSKRFWLLVVFRCLQGGFNGNIGNDECCIPHRMRLMGYRGFQECHGGGIISPHHILRQQSI